MTLECIDTSIHETISVDTNIKIGCEGASQGIDTISNFRLLDRKTLNARLPDHGAFGMGVRLVSNVFAIQ